MQAMQVLQLIGGQCCNGRETTPSILSIQPYQPGLHCMKTPRGGKAVTANPATCCTCRAAVAWRNHRCGNCQRWCVLSVTK